MTDVQNIHRRAIADAAEAVLADPGAYPAFAALVQAADFDDPKLEDLVDAIEHLPPRSRLFGMGEAVRDDHFQMIRGLIAAART
jgi:hypothetical protein